MEPKFLDYKSWKTPRWKAAIARRSLSMPMKMAIEKQVIAPSGVEVLDFGCGRGCDSKNLAAIARTSSYDPYFNHDTSLLVPTSVVALNYVVNVIECPQERLEVVRYCWSLTKDFLLVSVRTDGKGEVTTNIGTFQKYYTAANFREFIDEALGSVKIFHQKGGVIIIRR